jgi:predicted transcriptional regulator
VATTTVRLDEADERLLDALAPSHGGRSGAIRHALRQLAAHEARQASLEAFLGEWERELGPVDEAEIDELVERFDL